MSLSILNSKYVAIIFLLLFLSCQKKATLETDIALTKTQSEINASDIKPYLELLLLYKDSSYIFLQKEIKHIYEQNDNQPLWYKNGHLKSIAHQLIDTISQSHYYGLHPDFYPTKLIKHNLNKITQLKSRNHILYKKASTDLLITFSLINFISHLRFGIIRSNVIWNSEREFFLRDKVMAACYKVIDNKPLSDVIDESQPKSYFYKQLSNALKKFNLPDEWPEAETIYPINDKAKKDILTILSLSGFIKGHINDDLQQFPLIINSYQDYYNLPEKSFIGPATREHMMNNIFHRFKVIAVNIERLRQNPPLTRNYIWVNIPSYTLYLMENNIPANDIRVIVGSPKTPTPILSGFLSHVITYPKWNIPPSIVSKEIIPKLKRDSLYLKRKGYHITNWDGDLLNQDSTNIDSYTNTYYPFNIAQDPGPQNALGTMKFIFDNDHSIYLHDTNSRYLFSRKSRALSHGCIRVENPENLAKYLLSNNRIIQMENQMRNMKSGHVLIDKQATVYIRYITCEATKSGSIKYFDDIYNLNEKDWNNMLNKLYISSMPIEDLTDL